MFTEAILNSKVYSGYQVVKNECAHCGTDRTFPGLFCEHEISSLTSWKLHSADDNIVIQGTESNKRAEKTYN
jgi:hypothetical protein